VTEQLCTETTLVRGEDASGVLAEARLVPGKETVQGGRDGLAGLDQRLPQGLFGRLLGRGAVGEVVPAGTAGQEFVDDRSELGGDLRQH
jgi:hypothetical protein